MFTQAHREISRLNPEDNFLFEERYKDDFDFPIHFHPEYEINFIHNAKNARRIIGDSTEEIGDLDLVLVGPNLVHGWELHNCKSKKIHEITIHIPQDIVTQRTLSSKIFKQLKDMLHRSKHGILFSRETALKIKPRLKALPKITGVSYYLEFLSILDHLAKSSNQRMLSNLRVETTDFQNSDQIKKVYNYIQKNFHRKITLDEISEIVNMSPTSFNRFIKHRTGQTFVSYVNHTRISYASRLLLETDLNIGEICYKSGFSNNANFNKLFKKNKGCTPKEFKKQFIKTKRVL
ncbi:AraC family transcriptional regulator [uncultured Maribacter sp.]|uniref:AraC family transcriptional regulator n=1 Tax=uncultured Maribacter sp. TaxID=431308 RepID=UPI0026264770|nr:AraC family transcriptional regulator [uncultured Maribacter sp.]